MFLEGFDTVNTLALRCSVYYFFKKIYLKKKNCEGIRGFQFIFLKVWDWDFFRWKIIAGTGKLCVFVEIDSVNVCGVAPVFFVRKVWGIKGFKVFFLKVKL